MTDQFRWPDVVQVDPETVVTRQVGVPPAELVASDPVELPPIVQGDPETTTVRNPGNGHSFFDAAGVLHADHPSSENTLFSDGPFAATGDAILIADTPISRDTDAGYPGHPGVVPGIPAVQHGGALIAWAKPDQAPAPTVQPPGDVLASDKPAPGQQVEGAPQVFSAEQLAAAKAKKTGK